MSFWYEITDPEDVDFSLDGQDLHAYLYSDNFGAVYASIPVEIVREKLKELDEGE